MKTQNEQGYSAGRSKADKNGLPIWPIPVALGAGLLSFAVCFGFFVWACFSQASVDFMDGPSVLFGGLMIVAGLVSSVTGARHIAKRGRVWIGLVGIMLGASMIGVGVILFSGRVFYP